MAVVTKALRPNTVQLGVPISQYLGASLVAGENVLAGDLCYIKNDGNVWRCVATDGTAASDRVRFIAWGDFDAGQSMTVVEGPVTIGYSTGMTPGADLYLSATAGAMQTTAVYVGQAASAYVYTDGKRIRLFATR